MRSFTVVGLLILSGVTVLVQAKEKSETGKNEKRTVEAEERVGGVHLNIGIPVPNIPIPVPDPLYTYSHTMDYWPYKKFYSVHLSTVVQKLSKIFWYLYELAFLGLRVAFQIFDILQMRKSYEELEHVGGGWGDDDGRTILERFLVRE